MKINLKAFCLIGIILFIICINKGVGQVCNHSGPPGPNNPNPDPHRSHRCPCDPRALLECPCPDCEAYYESEVELQAHIVRFHGDCYYAIKEAFGNRGSSVEDCGGDFDDRHYFPTSDEDDDEEQSTDSEEASVSGPQLDRPSTSRDTRISIPCSQLDRPSTSKDTRISIPCSSANLPENTGSGGPRNLQNNIQKNQGNFIDLTKDASSDDSIEIIPLHDNSVQVIETNPNLDESVQFIPQPHTGPRSKTNNEIYWLSSDEDEGTWKATNGKTYCLPKRKRKKQKTTSTTNPPVDDNFSKHGYYSSSTQGPGSGMMSYGSAIGGMICHLVVTSSTRQRHPRSVNDGQQLTASGNDYWKLFSEQTEHLISSSTLGQRMPPSVSWSCETLIPKPVKTWRNDFRCGGNWLTESAEVAGCNPDNDSAHCCSEFNYCGNSRHHCHSPGSVDYRNYSTRIRSEDNLCGFGHLSPSGLVAICDPHSNKPCCSQYGRCGGEDKHCRNGTDFRKVSEFTETRRKDGLCGHGRGGKPYLAKDGKTAICTSSECCSMFNFCGEGPDYCGNGTNFTAMSTRELEKFRSQ